jgi:hypothetical protein
MSEKATYPDLTSELGFGSFAVEMISQYRAGMSGCMLALLLGRTSTKPAEVQKANSD